MHQAAKSALCRKVCVVSGTRADYGLLKETLLKMKASASLELQLVATGSHLSELHGSTINEIKQDGFDISYSVDIRLNCDSPQGISSSMAKAQTGFSSLFSQIRPDILLILGDRYEILAAALAAMFEKIPIFHIHGGEITEGAYDNNIRHCITKLAHFHFVSHQRYRDRVIQMGELPETVMNVGSLGVEALQSIKLFTKTETEAHLGFKFSEKNILVTFHPETLSKTDPVEQLDELFRALDAFPDTLILFTAPNADTQSNVFISLIQDFVAKNPNSRKFVHSLGQKLYFSTVNQIDVVVGNSSSGVLEVPSLGVVTLNIGNRQQGRIQAESVQNCPADHKQIIKALERIAAEKLKLNVKKIDSPYEPKNASGSILNTLENYKLDSTQKLFFDFL